ncbi:putative alcohol dehydrogenase AdhA [Mycobacterium xenopi 4042]|uniref:alcohol dehydrogenase n=1 Tax=Mycobacterium xenopi 4042 TaxID=1299334 RepID=X8BH38_MYCXE|nr:putative alcohol dehydrogenase AdhA [Mycobacterium xenopi 4042]
MCPESRYTGWDADGGYAEFATVPAAYAHQLPSGYSDTELAPLLCAGIIGYRALLRAELPSGGRLGLYGFGGSAHITAQVALAQGAEVHVMTRGVRARNWRWNSAPHRRKTPATRRQCHWMRPSCSLRSAIWCCRPCRPWIVVARWRSPGSTSAISHHSTTSATYSRNARSVRSPPIPAPTRARFWISRAASHRGDDAGIPASTS